MERIVKKIFEIYVINDKNPPTGVLEVELREFPNTGSVALMYRGKKGWYTAYEINKWGEGKTFNGYSFQSEVQLKDLF